MQKINFQNLPNTTTPVNATNLNQLQTNVESEIDGRDYRQSFTISANSSKTLSFTYSYFHLIFSARSGLGGAHATYIITGYGYGGSDRYKILNVEGNASNNLTFSINEQTITISNSLDQTYNCSLFFLIGNRGNVSIG